MGMGIGGSWLVLALPHGWILPHGWFLPHDSALPAGWMVSVWYYAGRLCATLLVL